MTVAFLIFISSSAMRYLARHSTLKNHGRQLILLGAKGFSMVIWANSWYCSLLTNAQDKSSAWFPAVRSWHLHHLRERWFKSDKIRRFKRAATRTCLSWSLHHGWTQSNSHPHPRRCLPSDHHIARIRQHDEALSILHKAREIEGQRRSWLTPNQYRHRQMSWFFPFQKCAFEHHRPFLDTLCLHSLPSCFITYRSMPYFRAKHPHHGYGLSVRA